MLRMCVYMHSRFTENHSIWILEDGPLISEVVLSQRAPRGLRGGVGQDLADRGLPTSRAMVRRLRTVVQSSSSATVRPLARMSGRGDRECARVVCSKRRKERKGERGVVVGHFNGRGGREKEKGGSPVWDTPRSRRSWGRVWGTGAAVGQHGVASTSPEPMCAGGRRTPVHNRGGGVAIKGAPTTVPGGGG
jgi:hypothetical protein